MFGSTPAQSFSVISATTITAVVAAGESGAVSIETPGGTASMAGFTFILPTAIGDNPMRAGFTVFPNPTDGHDVYIELDSYNPVIEGWADLVDVNGKLVAHVKIESRLTLIDSRTINAISDGLYLLHVTIGKKHSVHKLAVLQGR